MVSLKIFVVLAVVAVAYGNPAPNLLSGLGALGKPLSSATGNSEGSSLGILGLPSIYGHGGGLVEALGHLFVGLQRKGVIIGDIINDILHLKIAGTLDDVSNLLVEVGEGVGSIIDSLIPGLGTVFGKIVVALAKIILCNLGSEGVVGHLIGDQRGGYANRPQFCTKDYSATYGGIGIGGAADIQGQFGIENPVQSVQDIMDKHRASKGQTSASEEAIFKVVLECAQQLEDSDNLSPNDISKLYAKVIAAMSIVGTGKQDGLGQKIAEGILPLINKGLKNGSNGQQVPEIQIDDVLKHIQGVKGGDLGNIEGYGHGSIASGDLNSGVTGSNPIDEDGGNGGISRSVQGSVQQETQNIAVPN